MVVSGAAFPCIKCTDAAAVLSDVVVSSSNDIGSVSGCIDVVHFCFVSFGHCPFVLIVVSGVALFL